MQIDLENLKKEIQHLCTLSYKCKSFTQYFKIKNDFENLTGIYKLMQGEDIDMKLCTDAYYELLMDKHVGYRYKLIEKYAVDIDQHSRIAKNVISTFNNLHFIRRKPRLQNLSERDIIDLIREFLNSYDSNLDKIFMDIKDKMINQSNKKDSENFTASINVLPKSYITLETNHTIEGASTIIHELGHAYYNKIFENISYKQQVKSYEDYFYEAFSMFLENLFVKFLLENNIRTNEAHYIQNIFFDNLWEFFFIIKVLKPMIKTQYIDDEEINLICSALIYGYGGIVALELLDKYNQDSELTKYNIRRFILSQGILEDQDLLDVVGITYSDLESCKVLKKNLKEHNRNINKIEKF